VDTDPDGDVVVTVHRLDDAAGLEKALAARGIDADVSYRVAPDGVPAPTDLPTLPGLPDSGAPSTHAEGDGTTGDPAEDCGFGDDARPPASLARDGEDWVLTIPAGSPLLVEGRHLQVGTSSNGVLDVVYEGARPGLLCAVAQMQRVR
jgi:hypothetical protein